MGSADEKDTGAFDPTLIEGSGSNEPSQLDKRLIDEAIKQGLITSAQGTIVLDTICAEPPIDAEGTIDVMVQRGLITKDAGDSLLEKIVDDFIPGYQLGKELGRGAMGVVYEGTQRKLDRKVALKVVNPSLSSDASYVKRFKREALALAKLNHPNIVQVYDYGEADGRIYLALEFVEGEDCSELIKREGQLEERHAARIMHQSAMGLSHAKQAGIIHRDIKPANLLLTHSTDASTETLSAKVTDLGLAREAKNEGVELTQEGTILGTPAYMAPEQTRGEPADYRSDIYALGATFYHMLTGTLPYHDTSIVNILIKKRTELLPNPQLLIPTLSDGAVRVIDRMLAREPEHRYQDYEQLVSDLASVIAGEQVMTPPVPRAHSSLDLDPTSSAARPTTKIIPPPAEEPAGSPLPALAAIAVLAIVIVVVVIASRKPPAQPSKTSEVVSKTQPVKTPAADALADRLDALEQASPRVVLSQLPVLIELRDGIRKLPQAPQEKLLLRWQDLLTQAVEKTRAASTDAARSTWQAGQYQRLKSLIEAAIAPYQLLGLDPPARWVALGKKAEAALTQGAGAAERKAWAAARAEWERPKEERDAIKVIGLLSEFEARFASFSPVLKKAKQILREAEARSPKLTLRTVPASATIHLMGKQVGTGTFEGRVTAGTYLIRAKAPGHFDLKRAIEVSAEATETLYLGPKPARTLRQNTELGPGRKRVFSPNNRAKFARQWSPIGGWSLILAGVVGRAEAGKSATIQRDLRESLQRIRAANAPGWSLGWRQQLKRPDRDPKQPTPAELQAAKLEVTFLAGPGHEPRLRFANGWMTLLIKVGDAERVLTTVDYRTKKQIPRSFKVDFDGKVAVVHLDMKILHSFAVDWSVRDEIMFKIDEGEVSLFDFSLFGLRE